MKKKILALILAAVMILTCAACGSGSTEAPSGAEAAPAPSESSKNDSGKVIAPPVKETEPPAAPLADAGTLGKYDVSIGEMEFIQDYSGSPAILIHFTFTNNSEDNQSAMFSLSCKAFQNGIGLSDATIMDDSIHASEDLMKDIQPGVTIDLTQAYLLSSDTAPVEFYVSEAISFNDDKLGKVFEVAPGGTTVLSVAPGLDSAVEIGNYSVSVNSYEISKDYNGNPALILNMGYTNNSNGDSPFYAAVEVTAFQDGIELEKAYYFSDDSLDNTNNYLNVLPGAGCAVAEAFVLTSDTSPVEIEIAETFSFDDEKITTTIDITE